MQKLRYTFSLVTQGDVKFYSLTMPSDVLTQCCFVTTREEDPQKGFQRVLDQERAQAIADYIDARLGTVPGSVVLSAQPDAELRTRTEEPEPEEPEDPESDEVLRRGSAVKNGGGWTNLLEPLIVVREYPFQWKRPEIDRSELAKLRSVEGWSQKKLARHFGRSRSRMSELLGTLGKLP